jgi:SNF2 family DNA or RNA helicase
MSDDPTGSVRFAGDWIEVTFPHDLRVTHALRGLGGRRMGIGVWQIPMAQLPELTRRLDEFDITWEGNAKDAHRDQESLELRWREEDDLAMRIKAGEAVLGNWMSPVPLLDHQRAAVEFLASRHGALLCDEQGLGKTLSCLVAFWLVREQGKAKRLVVVCPNSLKFTWKNEIARFFPDWNVSMIAGYKRRRQQGYEQPADVYLVNYESARGDYAELRLLLRRTPTVLVLDESHTAKNVGSRTTRSLAFARSAAERVWIMSGTPVPNSLEDAFSQVFLADGGRTLGSHENFRRRFVRAADQDRAIADLKVALEPVLLRRTKDEVLDLPEKVFEDRFVQMKGRQRELYETIRLDLLGEIKGMSDQEFRAGRPNVLTKLLRLSQAASNPRLILSNFNDDPAKQLEIDALLEELIGGNGRKVVLWSYYVDTIEDLLERYAEYEPVAIYGAIPIAERSAAVERFQEDPAAMLFVGNPQAAATGLTLTAAHYAIYETVTWRYDLYAQSLDRIHRIGQDRTVVYFNILAADSVDLDITASLERKRDVAANLLGDFDRSTGIGRDEVMAMLSRRPS